MAILLALCCLFFAALNDFVFKLFASRRRAGRGSFVFLIGLVWFSILAWLPWSQESKLGATLLWGTISGFFSLTSNLLLIESMGILTAGLCSIIYRLNLVFVVLGAMVFLGESLSLTQGIGVLAALAAILAFMPEKTNGAVTAPSEVRARLAFYAVLLAAILRAGMGLAYKFAFTRGADPNGVVTINSLFWIFGGLLYAWLREKNLACQDRQVLGYGLLSGLLVCGIVFFMAASLKIGKAAVVLPIAQMSFLGTFAMSTVFLQEKLTRRKLAALLLGAIAIVLLTLDCR